MYCSQFWQKTPASRPLVYWQETGRNEAPNAAGNRLWASGRILELSAEYVDWRAFVPYGNRWLTTQNPVELTLRVGSIPTSGTNFIQ